MALKVIPVNDITKLDRQIKALRYQLKHDTDDKSRQIHKMALEELEAHREKLLRGIE